MKHRGVFFGAGLTGVLALVVLLSITAAGTAGTATRIRQRRSSRRRWRTPTAIKAKYGGKSITFIGDNIGGTHKRDLALAKRFTKDTGIKVKLDPASGGVDRVVLAARAASSRRSRRRSTS